MPHHTAKDRVLAALDRKKLDRPPVVCFTQIVTVDAMESVKVYWPDAHTDAKKMAELGAAPAKLFGLECVRLPFCLTVEAEVMGCRVDLGKMDRTPMVKAHAFDESNIPDDLPANAMKLGRIPVVVEATRIAKEKYGNDLPIVAGTTGPFTIAGHMVGTENLLLWIITNPEAVVKAIKLATKLEKAYIEALDAAGADVIVMSDPSASTDMLSGEMFDEYAKPYIKECFSGVKHAKTVLHICGDTTILLDHMINTGVTALSIEEKVQPEAAVKIVNHRAALVGNIGVVRPLLQGTPEDVTKEAIRVKNAGFDLVAPGCGLAARVPAANLHALVKAIKG
ncbi:MAG TPA: MtaA/CmuA family methyltransferase [Methanomassiliicoccales archaeon]|nr:MtaA/CmuA family methyltransferase [Methanomassiliicoccales archaeon]